MRRQTSWLTSDPRRAVTPIDHHGDHVAALIHDAALTYEPELLEVVCAARKELSESLAELRELARGGQLRVVSPAGGGTVLAAELPCEVRTAAR